VIRYNAGLVGGELQLAILEKRDDGTWIAHHEDPGETEQQVDSIEKNIFRTSARRDPRLKPLT
jgi:hypothetical protein